MIRPVFMILLTSAISLTLILSGFSQININDAVGIQDKTKDKNPLSVPARKGGNLCFACHENLKDKKLNKPVHDWLSSVHNNKENNCNICHGGNPDSNDAKIAMGKEFNFVGRPDKKTVTDFCGRGGCHAQETSDFKTGPHFAEVLKGNKPNCTHCHGIHNIKKSSDSIIDGKVCLECHSANHTKNIVSVISSIDQNIDSIDNNLKYLKQKHANIDSLVARLNSTKRLFSQMVHVSSKEELKSTKTIIELEIKNINVESKNLTSILKRLDLLYMLMVVISVVIIITVTSYTIYMLMKRRKSKK